MRGRAAGAGPAGLAALVLGACAGPGADEGRDAAATAPPSPSWTPIFDGETLDGWTPKIAGYPFGENFGDTFRVEDGTIAARFDAYGDDFADRFGVLYYAVPHDHYRLRLEYRFTGEQVPGAPDWARLNSGVLYHSQPPETLALDQGFPVSLEAQFLAEGAHAPMTGSHCSIETSIRTGGVRPDDHCLGSTVPARPLGQWVRFELEAAPDGTFRHYIDGELAFEYDEPRYDEAHPWAAGMVVEGGHFALQSESHPVAFRDIELMVLGE